jgi:hypothetical protein
MQGALNIGSTSKYPIYNINFGDIDINDSRCHALCIRAASNKPLSNIALKNITVNKAAGSGIQFSEANGTISGTMTYCNLSFKDVQREMNSVPAKLSWTQAENCQTPLFAIEVQTTMNQNNHTNKFVHEGKLFISVNGHTYDSMGRLIY